MGRTFDLKPGFKSHPPILFKKKRFNFLCFGRQVKPTSALLKITDRSVKDVTLGKKWALLLLSLVTLQHIMALKMCFVVSFV